MLADDEKETHFQCFIDWKYSLRLHQNINGNTCDFYNVIKFPFFVFIVIPIAAVY